MASTYVMEIIEGGLKFNISWDVKKGFSATHVSPNQEAIEAFVLTFRYFIQNNERISFGSLNNNVLPDPAITDNWRNEFTRVRNDVNQLLESGPMINYIVMEKELKIIGK
jgi:hypothetical protein